MGGGASRHPNQPRRTARLDSTSDSRSEEESYPHAHIKNAPCGQEHALLEDEPGPHDRLGRAIKNALAMPPRPNKAKEEKGSKGAGNAKGAINPPSAA